MIIVCFGTKITKLRIRRTDLALLCIFSILILHMALSPLYWQDRPFS